MRRGGGDIRICHNIFEKIISLDNLFFAWREFKRGKINKSDVKKFYYSLEDNLFDLRQNLLNRHYQPDKYEFFYVRDPKLRPIHKASVRDRVLFQAVFRVLYHIFDKHFIFDSYSSRLDKGTHAGVRRLEQFVRQANANCSRPTFALKCDVKKFFYSIDHDILFDLIKHKISDPDALWLIDKIIASFEIERGKGLPLGNVTSQLFANIYLNELDQFVKHVLKQKYYLRYCDDFVILGNCAEDLRALIKPINNFLMERLKLSLHPNKVEIRKLSQGIDFLGYVILPHHIVLRTKTKRRMFRKLRQRKLSLDMGIITSENYNQSLQSYLGILKHCNGHKLSQQVSALYSSDAT